jgi:hypothetical protein
MGDGMIRTLAVAAAMLALWNANASAQNVLSFWNGVAVIDSITNACKTAGSPPGSSAGFIERFTTFRSSYRAKLAPGEPNSGITFLAARSMQSYFNSPGTGNTASDQMHGGTGIYALRVLRGNVTSVPNPSQPNVLTGNYRFRIKPSVITAATDAITIDGIIFDWRGVNNCTVRFRGSYRADTFNVP